MKQLKSYQLLEDCKTASVMLEEEESDISRWRVKWAGSVALLRAVGHVLLYEDAPQNQTLKASLDKRFQCWKDDQQAHAIFWEFIVIERDGLLKRYKFGVSIENSIALETELHGTSSLEIIEGDIYRPYNGDFRTNDDARDLFSDAIKWWEYELERIWRPCK